MHPRDCLSTLLASCRGIKTISVHQPQVSDMLLSTHHGVSNAGFRILTIESFTIELRLALYPDEVTVNMHIACVEVRLDDNVELLLTPVWDRHPSRMDIMTPLKGLLLEVADSSGCRTDSSHYAMLIMEQHDDHWERVSITPLYHNYMGVAQDEEKTVCEFFPAASSQVLRHTPSGALYTGNICSVSERSTQPLDLSLVGVHCNEPW